MHPDALSLTEHALDLGLSVEVFTNLVHVSPRWWDLFQRAGVSVATSYYSADPAEHNAVTRRPPKPVPARTSSGRSGLGSRCAPVSSTPATATGPSGLAAT